MKLTLKRFKETDDATLGALYVGDVFQCYTLEDEHRDIKVAGETRIPAGEYELIDRRHGGFYNRYKNLGAWHEGMIEVKDVPGFKHILIHRGNTDEDTAGCILVGKDHNEDSMTIQSSAVAYENLYKKIYPEVTSGRKVTLTIKDKE